MKPKLRWLCIIVIGVMLFGTQALVSDEVRAEESQRDVLIDLFGDEFVSADEVASAMDAGTVGEIIAGPNDEDLVFTPVQPCRIVDTRKSCPACGVFTPGDRREFYVYGTTDISNQGGNPAGCPSPRGEPAAVHMNVVAVPVSGQGNIGAFPANISPPLTALLNYKAGVQNVANAGTIKAYFQVAAREIEIINRNGSTHLVIDVMGYYYSMP